MAVMTKHSQVLDSKLKPSPPTIIEVDDYIYDLMMTIDDHSFGKDDRGTHVLLIRILYYKEYVVFTL